MIAMLLERHPEASGLYHLSSSAISKHDLLVSLRDLLKRPVEIVPDDSVRIDRSLDSSRFRGEFEYEPPSWECMLDELATIPGSVPNLIELPEGCRFSPRCLAREEHGNVLADRIHPELRSVGDDHLVRCWLYHHEDGSRRPDPDTWPEAGT